MGADGNKSVTPALQSRTPYAIGDRIRGLNSMFESLGVSGAGLVWLVLALGLALAFEFVNGFHDTANAVATVIYTHTLRPTTAVVWSGLWNLLGVLVSSGAVAYSIVALLPVELVLNVGSGAGAAMVFALLLAAIIWNVGTWFLGLPASSSHTLIGAIVGVGLMNSYLTPGAALGEGVNWGKVADVGKALLLSPLIGFCLAALVLLLFKALVRVPALFEPPRGDQPPPWPVRILLMLTCTGVSFAHGSNDGQKGMGLMVLILVGLAPMGFAINPNAGDATLRSIQADTATISASLAASGIVPMSGEAAARQELTLALRKGVYDGATTTALARVNASVQAATSGTFHPSQMKADVRRDARVDMYLESELLAKLAKAKALPAGIDATTAGRLRDSLKSLTFFIPTWVKLAVALALGLGTMIGWKRIVVTVGEKIGKVHMTYAQGASAELVAMVTIGAADVLGLPVSTTHVLSSGIAGTMFANKSGIQSSTVRNVLIAWVLTLPACVLLGAGLFAAGLYLVFHVFGIG